MFLCDFLSQHSQIMVGWISSSFIFLTDLFPNSWLWGRVFMCFAFGQSKMLLTRMMHTKTVPQSFVIAVLKLEEQWVNSFDIRQYIKVLFLQELLYCSLSKWVFIQYKVNLYALSVIVKDEYFLWFVMHAKVYEIIMYLCLIFTVFSVRIWCISQLLL